MKKRIIVFKLDLYSRLMLSIIAFSLTILSIRSLIGIVNAQMEPKPIQDVNIAMINGQPVELAIPLKVSISKSRTLPVKIEESDLIPVSLENPQVLTVNLSKPEVLSVNIVEPDVMPISVVDPQTIPVEVVGPKPIPVIPTWDRYWVFPKEKLLEYQREKGE